jgi:hypothetical protein
MKCPDPELSVAGGSLLGMADARWRGRYESSRSRPRWIGLKFGMRIEVGCGTVVCGPAANGDALRRDVAPPSESWFGRRAGTCKLSGVPPWFGVMLGTVRGVERFGDPG